MPVDEYHRHFIAAAAARERSQGFDQIAEGICTIGCQIAGREREYWGDTADGEPAGRGHDHVGDDGVRLIPVYRLRPGGSDVQYKTHANACGAKRRQSSLPRLCQELEASLLVFPTCPNFSSDVDF